MRGMVTAFTCQWLKVNRHTLRVCYARDSKLGEYVCLGPLSDPGVERFEAKLVTKFPDRIVEPYFKARQSLRGLSLANCALMG
jgi:hypothetical protein